MPIDPKTTALLLIEYQNDFTSEGGALHNGVKSVMHRETGTALHQALPGRLVGSVPIKPASRSATKVRQEFRVSKDSSKHGKILFEGEALLFL